MKKTKNLVILILVIAMLSTILIGCSTNKPETENKATVVGIEASLKSDSKITVGDNFDSSKFAVQAQLSDNTSRLVSTDKSLVFNVNRKFALDSADKKYKPNDNGEYILDAQNKFIKEGIYVLTVSFSEFTTTVNVKVNPK